MRRADYLNPDVLKPAENAPVDPSEESIYDQVMNIIRFEVDKASRDFVTIANTPENRQRLKNEITKAIQLAIVNYVTKRDSDPTTPPTTNPLTPEMLQQFLDMMRRVDRTRETVAPMWPDWSRDNSSPFNPTPFNPTPFNPTPPRPIYYRTTDRTTDRITDINNNYYMTNSDPFALYTTSDPFALYTTGSNMNMTYSNASVLIDSNNSFNRKLIDETWVEAFTGIMNHEAK